MTFSNAAVANMDGVFNSANFTLSLGSGPSHPDFEGARSLATSLFAHNRIWKPIEFRRETPLSRRYGKRCLITSSEQRKNDGVSIQDTTVCSIRCRKIEILFVV